MNLIKKYLQKELDKARNENQKLLSANTRLQDEISALQVANYELNKTYEDMQKAYQSDHESYISGMAEINKLKEEYKKLILSMKNQKQEYEKQMKVLLGL